MQCAPILTRHHHLQQHEAHEDQRAHKAPPPLLVARHVAFSEPASFGRALAAPPKAPLLLAEPLLEILDQENQEKSNYRLFRTISFINMDPFTAEVITRSFR